MTKYSSVGENMIRNAEIFATAAHGAIDQRRKYTGEPYIVHPRTVAGLVQACRDHTWPQVVLAWLHDTVEDTKITLDTVGGLFGDQIATGLHFLTNVDSSAGNRAQRHLLNVARLERAPGWVKTVKVADIYDNTKRIVELDPVFAPKYLKEKEHAMLALRGADHILWELTFEQIQRLNRELLLAAA